MGHQFLIPHQALLFCILRRAKSDGINSELLLRTLLAWLRGEPHVWCKEFIADDTINHRADFARCQSIDSEAGHLGSSNPWRLELGSERHDQHHAEGC
jgi:hypothetical protein